MVPYLRVGQGDTNSIPEKSTCYEMLQWSSDWMDSLEWPKECKMYMVFGTSNVTGITGQGK
jgi:hypothetical protein